MRTAAPLYLPFLHNTELVRLASQPLDLQRWIEPDEQFNDYIDNKKKLYDHNSTYVHAALPGSETAQREFSTRLRRHLLDNPRYPADAKQSLENTNPEDLWDISPWVQDDLCLLEKTANAYCLTAASLCAPSEWLVQEKIGLPIHDIHAPVPRLNDKIGNQINHMLEKLSPLRPLERFNWSLKSDPRLALFPNRPVLAESNELYLRVERQTLVRLPTTDGIAFTIRVYIYPLEQLLAVEGALDALTQAINAMSAEEVHYKSLANLYPQYLRFCKNHCVS